MHREMNPVLHQEWEYNVLGVTDHRAAGSLRFYFDFIRSNYNLLDGDIVEAGVYQGKSLLGLALMLKELGSNKKVYGYDSFTGFPPVYDEKDRFERFEELLNDGKISEQHYRDVKKNLEWRNHLSVVPISPASISSSGDFSLTSQELVEKKKKMLGLDNVVLVDGPFHETMVNVHSPQKIMCTLIDCDLYQSYVSTLNFVWPRLVKGGLIYLDEYYSLKFPGARIAIDEFIEGHSDAELRRFPSNKGEFERWGMWKRL